MPTIYQRLCGEMVGTLRFAHPTAPAMPDGQITFRLSEVMSRSKFLKIKNIPLPFPPNQRHIAPVITAR